MNAFRALLSCGVLLVSLTTVAGAQTARGLKFIVPFPAGGSLDVLTRTYADYIGKAAGLSTVVENRPGAGAVLGADAVARAAPDGSTLLMMANSFVISRHIRALPYDPFTSFEPICHLVNSPQLIVVNNASPYKTLAELIAYARANPGALTIAANGPATLQHIGVELFKKAAAINLSYIPYAGSAPSLNALLGSHVNAVLANYGDMPSQLEGKLIRALATPSAKRIGPLPDVPTAAEAGAAFEATAWFGVMAPAKTPREIVARQIELIKAATNSPEGKAKANALGFYPTGMCGAEYGAFLQKEFEETGRVVREAGIKGE
jgi:tripartite-type tricarboxylate transporter receptor subunit TctC